MQSGGNGGRASSSIVQAWSSRSPVQRLTDAFCSLRGEDQLTLFQYHSRVLLLNISKNRSWPQGAMATTIADAQCRQWES